MTRYLGKHKKQLKNIPYAYRNCNIQNRNLYFDTYFNKNTSKMNFLSSNYSKTFHSFLFQYDSCIMGSCIMNPLIKKDLWLPNTYKSQYIIDKEYVGTTMVKDMVFNYSFFGVKCLLFKTPTRCNT